MSLYDHEEEDRRVLAAGVFELIADAAGEGHSARNNEEAFRRRSLIPKVLRDVSSVTTATTLLGRHVAAPVGISPLPRMAAVHPAAERGLAEAAAELGLVFCAATNSTVSLEELVVEGSSPWFQLYPHSDTGITRDLIARAVTAGYGAIVVTLDRPVAGTKTSEASKSTDVASYPNLAPYGSDGVVAGRYHPAFNWTDLDRLRQETLIPIVVKGVLNSQDARMAVDLGCDGIWVSNHGGRQLDRTIATLDVLEEIATAVDGRSEVFLDGGIRRGIDPFIAIALGARAVFVGRPMAYALAVDGAKGVSDALEQLTRELAHAMALMGAADVGDITPDHVRERAGDAQPRAGRLSDSTMLDERPAETPSALRPCAASHVLVGGRRGTFGRSQRGDLHHGGLRADDSPIRRRCLGGRPTRSVVLSRPRSGRSRRRSGGS